MRRNKERKTRWNGGEERCTEENKKRRKGTQKTAYLAKSTAVV